MDPKSLIISLNFIILIVHLIVPISSLITLGILLTIFGVKNRGNPKNIPITTGVSITLSYIFQIITTILYGTFLLDYSVYHLSYSVDPIWFTYSVLVNLSITTYLVGIVVLLGQSMTNDMKILGFAMMLMLIHFVVMTNLPWILYAVVNR